MKNAKQKLFSLYHLSICSRVVQRAREAEGFAFVTKEKQQKSFSSGFSRLLIEKERKSDTTSSSSFITPERKITALLL